MTDSTKRVAGTRTGEENPRYICSRCTLINPEAFYNEMHPCSGGYRTHRPEKQQRREEERRRTGGRGFEGQRNMCDNADKKYRFEHDCRRVGWFQDEPVGKAYFGYDRRGPDKRKPIPIEKEGGE